MTPNPLTVKATATIVEAAKKMKEADIGPVLVLEKDKVCGIVTDRDIAIRAVAEGRNPAEVKVADICSRDLVVLAPDASIDEAVKLMEKKAVRRLPVVDKGKPVGIVALGDLAEHRDPKSALGKISQAAPNN